ncbi:hypothetical protein IQ251_15175 [Saccharopolyspora sp. HNM0983]|uniref:Secreted protein n=1 Tax=Saccharopolyspora montiporae TaxID=2781240 RepID=A0A929BD00_9PSEU|nr:hypothetical protein [Saccharopolyspora sp. HNM0983]MBE9375793.1 hypothetical protein [Saccharopolyspora sp. HNM0983]
MHPWTTRTVKAAVVAAGFAAVGTGTAAAADEPELTKPDLSSVPDEIGFKAPINACSMQEQPGFGSTKAPCADAELYAKSPNLVKKVGTDITRAGHGVADELRAEGPLLTPEKPSRITGHLVNGAAEIEQATKARPTVGGSATPDHLGLLTEHTENAELLDAEIGPRGPQHSGTSALDTAVELTAAQGYSTEPVAEPVGAVMPLLENNPLQTSREPVTVEPLEETVPAAQNAPVVSELDDAANSLVDGAGRELGNALPDQPAPLG